MLDRILLAMGRLKSTFDDLHRMVMAHAAREETMLFPAMEGTWSEDELDGLKEATSSTSRPGQELPGRRYCPPRGR